MFVTAKTDCLDAVSQPLARAQIRYVIKNNKPTIVAGFAIGSSRRSLPLRSCDHSKHADHRLHTYRS